jgi:uncharacterized DUF497 family protein
MALRFTWDSRKAVRNLNKHGISFPEATTAFGDSLSVTIPDPDHSVGEHRYLLVGLTALGHLVVVAHSERGDEIRLISARRASRAERETYEEGD